MVALRQCCSQPPGLSWPEASAASEQCTANNATIAEQTARNLFDIFVLHTPVSTQLRTVLPNERKPCPSMRKFSNNSAKDGPVPERRRLFRVPFHYLDRHRSSSILRTTDRPSQKLHPRICHLRSGIIRNPHRLSLDVLHQAIEIIA